VADNYNSLLDGLKLQEVVETHDIR